jgi:signal transduction histidine kinase
MENEQPTYKHLEEEVNRLNGKLTNLEKHSLYGYWDLEIKTGKLFCSDQVFEILGVLRNEYTANVENFRKSVHPEDINKLSNIISKDFSNAGDIDTIFRIIRPGGEIRIIQSKTNIFCENGEAVKAFGTIQDITDNEKSKNQMLEIDFYSEQILNAINTGVLIINPENGFIEKANQPLSKLIDIELNQIIGKECTSVFNSENEGLCAIKNQENDIENIEKEFTRKDGSKLPLIISIKKININGQQKIIETFVDNSQNKLFQEVVSTSNKELFHAKEKLEENIKLLSAFIKHSPIYAFIKEVSPEECWVVNASDNFIDMVGIPGSEMEGKTMEELFPPDFAKKITADDLAVVTDGKILKLDENLNNKHYTTIKFPISLGDKKMLAGYTIDITERVKAELTLKDNESKMRAILDAMPDMMFIQDMKGTYLDFYIPYQAVTYKPPKVFLGQSINEVLPPKIAEEFINVINRAIETCQIQLFEYSLQMPDGFHYYEARTIAYDNNKILSIVRDITSRFLDEQTIKQKNDELLKLITDKDRFMSILAHDLRSPFNNIIGFVELLIKNIRVYNIDKIESILKILGNSIFKTYNLFEDILQWAKSQAGQLPYEPVNVSFNDVSQLVIHNIINLARAKKISINCFESEPIVLFADLNMLKTILRNLISNAIKFTAENGKIKVYCEKDGAFAIITVSDSGVGILKNDLDKIFDDSLRFSTKGTAKEEGTGLGLILCKEFVEKHGGRIWVESEPGKGSNFKFTIPLFKL